MQPLVTALFANSPFTDGKLNGFLSARSEIWRDTDDARTGMLPFAFEPGMGFERYVDYALDVPMYFVKRGGPIIDVAGASFRDLLAGRLAALPGERATISDWVNHLLDDFSRSAPQALSRNARRRCRAAGAHRGAGGADGRPLLRCGRARGGRDLIGDWSAARPPEPCATTSPRLGLKARIGGRGLREVARDMLAMARGGLKRRARLDADGRDETIWLRPLEAIAECGRVAAQDWIAASRAGGAARSIRPLSRRFSGRSCVRFVAK